MEPGPSSLVFATSAAATEWIPPRLEPAGRTAPRVAQLVPSGFDRYVRLWHPRENSQGQRALGRLADPVLAALVHHLSAGADLDEVRVWAAYWEGWGDLARGLQALTRRRTWTTGEVEAGAFAFDEYRRYVLLTGPLAGLLTPGQRQFHLTPQLWWPEDHSWFVASEIDFDLTLVGADARTSEAILFDPALECDEVHVGDVLTQFGDRPW